MFSIISTSSSYFFFFSLVGVLIPYLSIYLSDLGYSSENIGAILSIIGIARILSPVFWDKITKNISSPKKIATGTCMASLLSLIPMIFIKKEYYFYFIFFIFNFFWAAILPQIEILALRMTKNYEIDYSRIRRWGSVGYLVATVLASTIISHYGSITYVYLLIIIDGLLIISILLIKDISIINNREENPNRDLFKSQWYFNKKLWLFLTITLLVQASHGPYYAFFVLFVNKLGWSTSWAGIMLSIGVLSEIFVFTIMHQLLSKFQLKYLLWFSILLTIIRWVIFAQFAEYAVALWLGILLHGISFAAIHALSMQWISKEIPDSNQSIVQALYSGLGFGGGGALGAGIAGFLWNEGINSTKTFYFAALCVLIAFIASLFIFNLKSIHKK